MSAGVVSALVGFTSSFVVVLTGLTGLAIAGVSAAFWALVAGGVVRLVLRAGRP